MTSQPCIFKWIQFASGIRYTCSRQTPFDWVSRYYSSVCSKVHEPERKYAACATFRISEQMVQLGCFTSVKRDGLIPKKSKTGYILLPLQFCNLEKWVTEAQFARHLNASTRTLPLSDQQPRCSTVKSHFRVERLLWSHSSGQPQHYASLKNSPL